MNQRFDSYPRQTKFKIPYDPFKNLLIKLDKTGAASNSVSSKPKRKEGRKELTWIRIGSVRDHLHEEDSERPHIRLDREPVVEHRFGRRPLHGKLVTCPSNRMSIMFPKGALSAHVSDRGETFKGFSDAFPNYRSVI